MKKGKYCLIITLVILTCVGCASHKSEWVEKNGSKVYYDENGKQVKNKKMEIDQEWYSFDKNGYGEKIVTPSIKSSVDNLKSQYKNKANSYDSVASKAKNVNSMSVNERLEAGSKILTLEKELSKIYYQLKDIKNDCITELDKNYVNDVMNSMVQFSKDYGFYGNLVRKWN